MKLLLGIGAISLMLLFGGCSTTTTPESGQPDAQGAAGQPGQLEQTGQPAQPGQESPSSAQVDESMASAPPALPVYEQPVIPGPGYIWTPGYWASSTDDGDYYWVPGTWVQPPEPEVLWTPGYWGRRGTAFVWNTGYWGPHVGFYGGVNYGHGYTGDGYEGGHWDHGAFSYNRSVNNITNVTSITHVYDKTVVNNVTVNNVSYYGGNGGLTAQPTAEQRTAATERHIPRTTEQTQHQHAASTERGLLASVNHGKPPIAATSKPGVFSGGGVVPAKAAAPYHPAVPAAAKGAAALSPNPAGGETRPPVTEPPARSQPKNEPRPQVAQPKIEPRPQAAQPKIEPHPQATRPKSAPPPSGEKPKEQHEPPR